MFMPEAMICKRESRVWKIIDEMHKKMKDEDPQKIEKLIDEAVKKTRKQRTPGEAQKRN